jgi:signal transduction histidine kinase
MTRRTFTQLPAGAVLMGTLLASLLPFLMVELFRASMYRVMDVPAYLVFHNITEFFSVMVSLSIFGVGWYSYDQSRDRHTLFLSAAFLAIGLLDFMHALSYAGMPPFVTPNSANKSTQFWIIARLFTASVFLASAYVYPDSQIRLFSKRPLMATVLTIPTLAFVGIIFFPAYVPDTFLEGTGLTAFKKNSEYLTIGLLVLASAAYWRRMSRTGNTLLLYYLAAFVLCIFSELVFAIYKSVYDSFNVLGHLYKVVAFYLIYKGTFTTSITSPYVELSHASENLRTEIMERNRAEEAYRALNRELEANVNERTGELTVANELLNRALGQVREAKERAEAADRTKSAFLATMSHELRTPLNSIIGFSGVLLQGLGGPLNREQSKQLGFVRDSANHLLALINDVLDLSKIEAGQLKVEPEEFDLSALLEKAVRTVRPLAEKKGLELGLAVAPGVGRVYSDARRVEQILLNLLSNAIKFTEAGSVRVECEAAGGRIEVCVVDTGIGIKLEDMGNLFKPFVQLDDGSSRRFEGTGLGLSICRHLTTLLGGEVRAESEFGKGSRFVFSLPVRQL